MTPSFAEGLTGLSTGVVELGGLTDDDWAGAYDEDFRGFGGHVNGLHCRLGQEQGGELGQGRNLNNGLRLLPSGVAVEEDGRGSRIQGAQNVVLPRITDVKKLMGLASSFVHCYFEDAGVGLINGVMVLRKDLERDRSSIPRTLARLLPLDRRPSLKCRARSFSAGRESGNRVRALVTTLEVDLGQVGAEGVVGTANLAEGLLHRLLTDCVEVCVIAPQLLVDLVSDGHHPINGEVLGGIRVDLCELVKDLLKGMARESLEIPKGTVDVEGYGCDVGEVGHCSGNSSIFIR